jgi:hypothetical protein
VSDHPVCADSERGLFLFGAATPPHEEGNTPHSTFGQFVVESHDTLTAHLHAIV